MRDTNRYRWWATSAPITRDLIRHFDPDFNAVTVRQSSGMNNDLTADSGELRANRAPRHASRRVQLQIQAGEARGVLVAAFQSEREEETRD